MPDKYKQMANEIDGLGWNDRRLHCIDCKEEEDLDVSDKYKKIGQYGLTENAQSYFAHRLNNDSIIQSVKDDKDIGLLAIEAILDGKSDFGIDAFIHLGIEELRKVNSWESPPADFLKAIIVAKKSGKNDLAADIFKGLLVYYEETASDFLWEHSTCISILDEAKSMLGNDHFQKAGFADKLEKYELLNL